MSDRPILPLGKLPPDLLAQVIQRAPVTDARILLGPGIGLDCAVIDMGESLLVFKTEPITFVTSEIGWYGVQIAANDIATTGAAPRWYLATLLLPERRTTAALVEEISNQAFAACQALGISLIGGHTEITYGLERPILVGTLVGEVTREKLVTPRGARPGDTILLTKGVPIEAVAILSREFPERLAGALTEAELRQAQQYLHSPGISVLRDAQIAAAAGRVTAMHDPTEGGLSAALWELAQASGARLEVEIDRIAIPPLAQKVCQVFGLNPLETIASGALLLTAAAEDAQAILGALQQAAIDCQVIGAVAVGEAGVFARQHGKRFRLPRPERDAITQVYA